VWTLAIYAVMSKHHSLMTPKNNEDLI